MKIKLRKNTDGRSEPGKIWDTAIQKTGPYKVIKVEFNLNMSGRNKSKL